MDNKNFEINHESKSIKSFMEILKLQETVLRPQVLAKYIKKEIVDLNNKEDISIRRAIENIRDTYKLYNMSETDSSPLVIVNKNNNGNYHYIPLENWTEIVARSLGINNQHFRYRELQEFFEWYTKTFRIQILEKLKMKGGRSVKDDKIEGVPDWILNGNWTLT